MIVLLVEFFLAKQVFCGHVLQQALVGLSLTFLFFYFWEIQTQDLIVAVLKQPQKLQQYFFVIQKEAVVIQARRSSFLPQLWQFQLLQAHFYNLFQSALLQTELRCHFFLLEILPELNMKFLARARSEEFE